MRKLGFQTLPVFIFTFLIISLFSTACKKEQQLPIPEEKLIQILSDIHIAEAALDKINGPMKDTAAIEIYDQIYTIYEISEADLDTCLYYLKRDPDAMGKLYEKVFEELDKRLLQIK